MKIVRWIGILGLIVSPITFAQQTGGDVSMQSQRDALSTYVSVFYQAKEEHDDAKASRAFSNIEDLFRETTDGVICKAMQDDVVYNVAAGDLDKLMEILDLAFDIIAQDKKTKASEQVYYKKKAQVVAKWQMLGGDDTLVPEIRQYLVASPYDDGPLLLVDGTMAPSKGMYLTKNDPEGELSKLFRFLKNKYSGK